MDDLSVKGCLLQEWVGTWAPWAPKWKWRYVTFDDLWAFNSKWLIVKEAKVGPKGVKDTEPYSSDSEDVYDSDCDLTLCELDSDYKREHSTYKEGTHVTKAKWKLSKFVDGDIKAKYDESGDLILYIKNRKFRDGFTYEQGVQCRRLVKLMRELRENTALKVPVPYSEEEREDDERIARINEEREQEIARINEEREQEIAREEALRKQERERKVALECLSSEQLCQVLLILQQCSAHAPVFARHNISGADAVEMGEEDLIEMGIRPGVKRHAILQALESYKATGVAAWMFE